MPLHKIWDLTAKSEATRSRSRPRASGRSMRCAGAITGASFVGERGRTGFVQQCRLGLSRNRRLRTHITCCWHD